MNPGPRPPRILAIDPGETESAAVLFSGMDQPIVCELKPNPLIRQLIVSNATLAVESGVQLAIECAAGYGVPISMNLIKTIEWYGRFAEAWLQQDPGTFALKVPRGVVKNHLDNAKTDAQVRDALIHLRMLVEATLDFPDWLTSQARARFTRGLFHPLSTFGPLVAFSSSPIVYVV